MNRFVVPVLAALIVSSPLSAQEPPKDTTKKPVAAEAKPGPKTDSAAGEVSRRDTTQARKDSLAPANAVPSNAAAPAKDPIANAPAITPMRPTFRCKNSTVVYVADSAKACAEHGGVDSVFAKPKP